MADASLPLTFRQELIEPLVTALRKGESCAVAGVAGVGKSELLRHLAGAEVRAYYLEEEAPWTVYLPLDSRRLAPYSEFTVLAALLERLAGAVSTLAEPLAVLAPRLAEWHTRAAASGTAGTARQNLERALSALAEAGAQHILVALDEFQTLIEQAPPVLFRRLRALREAVPGRLAFVTATRRDLSAYPPPNADYAGLFEILAARRFAVRPYGPEDAAALLRRIEERARPAQSVLTASGMERLFGLTGGHGGLLEACYRASDGGALALHPGLASLVGREATVRAMCQAIWDSLDPGEMAALSELARGQPPFEQGLAGLQWKGIVPADGSGAYALFSPLFARWLGVRLGATARGPFVLFQPELGTVALDERVIALTPVEYQLYRTLYEWGPAPCPRDVLHARLVMAEAGQPSAPGSPDERLEYCLDQVKGKLDLPGYPAIIALPEGSYRLPGPDQA